MHTNHTNNLYPMQKKPGLNYKKRGKIKHGEKDQLLNRGYDKDVE